MQPGAEEQGQAAWRATMQPGAAWGGEDEEQAAGGGGGQPAKRQRNARLDAMLAEKAAKQAALAQQLAPVSPPVVKRERGRPSGWTLRPDAPELLSPPEFDALSTKELQLLWGDYYTGSATSSKSGNRAYLRRKLVSGAGDDNSAVASSASGPAAAE